MKILSLIAGAGDMYCGSCLRDNALAGELKRRGHELTLIPLYTPVRTDGAGYSEPRVFFGGISVYLAQMSGLFRRLPKFLDTVWDLPGVIKAFAGRGVEVDPNHLGALTVSILQGEHGRQRKEIEHLLHWLGRMPPPDVVTIPYTLLISLARPLRQATGRPVVCTLQGEEFFLDGLREPYKSQALDLIRRQVADVDAFIAVSRYEREFMSSYLAIPREKIHVVRLGVDTAGSALRTPGTPEAPVFGFLGRIAPEKGLHLAAGALLQLRARGELRRATLRAAGYLAPERRGYLDEQRRRFRDAGCEDAFHYAGAPDWSGKMAFLQGLDLIAMPTAFDEPKGLPALEALANGVPVIAPRRGAFPELIGEAGGYLFDPGDASSLAETMLAAVCEWDAAMHRGRLGHARVHAGWTLSHMAAQTEEVFRDVAARAR
ncbi:MAG: glycosyltransferase family 4 protein [Bryobacterales bacterium]|nr:glycosyltransferase family 4 protein [Bryobacterales bacterium]